MTDFCTELVELQAGGKASISKSLSRIETSWDCYPTREFLDRAFEQERAQVIGITGPPGVGKSTLISSLVQIYRDQKLSVGVVAVDPSSRNSGGALLGDRTRFKLDPEDDGIFVRSMACRDKLGGLSEFTYPSVVLLQAIFDRVIVETVGVGQSETDISSVADTVVLCIQPASGDGLQYIKAGVIEIPDIAVVTKSDLGIVARQAAFDVRNALGRVNTKKNDWTIPVLAVTAKQSSGIDDLSQSISDHYLWSKSNDVLRENREQMSLNWLCSSIRERYGSRGLEIMKNNFSLGKYGERPFSSAYLIAKKFDVQISRPWHLSQD